VLWQLLSPNNRRLGQDATLRPSYAGCLAAIARLREGEARLESQALLDAHDGRWAWRLLLDGRTVAVSARSYLRARECDYNLLGFLTAVGSAELIEGANRVVRQRRERPDLIAAMPPAMWSGLS
jgi:hypothetical protein